MTVTRLRIVSRPSILCVTSSRNVPFYSKKRPFSTLNPSLRSQGKTNRLRFGIFSSIRSSMSSSMSPVSSEKQVERILEAKNDDHGGVIVEMTSEPMDPGVFTSLLRASLSHWRKEGKRGVWIKVPIDLVNLVEPAIKEGFYFHHAEPRYLMLVHWLPSSANTLPANATHRVGIGAFVLNEKNEVLVVQEKSGRLRGSGVWKFPTGVVDEGEDICDAAVREVKEETGIDSKFLEILAFRQSHKSFFGKSDLFFVCMMQPLSSDIQPQEAEIEAAQWMPYEEYTAQPFVQKHELLRYIADICQQKKEKGDEGYSGFSPVPTMTGFSDSKGYLYLNRLQFNRTRGIKVLSLFMHCVSTGHVSTTYEFCSSTAQRDSSVQSLFMQLSLLCSCVSTGHVSTSSELSLYQVIYQGCSSTAQGVLRFQSYLCSWMSTEHVSTA